ncbi:protein mono-ADP-ribosyltransferase PARP14-like [Mercenaria mercenaria]|uniref:protein mono-ADP-ribosyltransferase PARP14-like n=1 Tax=Mercenaria mercenaria TaxID=6596 RepID=UPI00234EC821|nr:protein mono-ADP-ribosyltransferase PARP14-like [Mercenaria mercenaria]
MFNAVSVFSRTNPRSSIRDVKFVVYHMDKETISAFENEQLRLQDAKPPKTNLGQLDTDTGDLGYDVIPHETRPGVQSTNGTYTFGNITVTVRQGDLISEDADCIVNSTNQDLNLSIGKVSKIILEKGGHALREELENHKIEMKSKKIAMTLAPGLTCKNIVHVVTDPNDLTGTVQKCLLEADDEMMTSIAFPALGTALDHTVSAETATAMIKAVRDFADNTRPRHLMDIRFVIFQKEMLTDFQKAAENTSDSNSWLGKAAGNVWKGFKNVFGMTGSGHKDVKKEVGEADFNSVTFAIMAFSDNVIRKVIQHLESSLEKEILMKTIDDHAIPLLEDVQVQEMYGIAKQYHVEMTMNKNKGIIQISGIVSNVMHASDKISG